MDSGQKYIQYLGDVLGIRSVLLPPAETVQPPARLIFLEDVGRSSVESLELFAKMKEAMKLKEEESLYLEMTSASLSMNFARLEQAEVLVAFSKTLAEFLTANLPHRILLLSPSPSEMLKDASLKREAWDVLKQAMKHLEQN
jgi:hypothetical protein